jgi:LmbE family N-acetylglucosaminyl deacetylase
MNVLAVGAHYDDVELGCSGTLIKHVLGGDNVTMLVITKSDYKNPSGEVIRDSDIACREGEKAAKLIGAELINLSYDTFMVTNDEDLTKTINGYINKLNIDTIYTHWINDLHRDHHNTSKCVLMAGRHAPRFLMYRSNFYDTEKVFRGNLYSDISMVIDKKREVIKAHESELDRVKYRWFDFFDRQHKNDGMKIGVEYAECFEVVRYLI